MSAPNFRTQKDFGLYVNDFVIPIYEDEENENSEVIEYLTDWHELRAVEKAVDELNRTLEFYGVEWDEKYLEQMTAEAVEEINEQYNARERLFEEEKICYIASELQYEAVA